MLQQKKLKTGTTTVGLVCKDCVVLAAESKSTLGWLVSSKAAQKIYQIDDRMAMAISGGVGDAQALVRIIKAEISLYKLTRNAEITLKAATTLLANILSGSRWFPYLVMPIVGGADKDGFHVYNIDPVGGVEEDKFMSVGSGSPVAYGVLEDEYKEAMAREEGTRIAVRAIRSARERDVFSGGRDIHVAVIDKDGLKFVDKEKIREIAK